MKTNRYIVIALLLSIFVSSCEDGFLKQDPQTSLSSEQVLFMGCTINGVRLV